MPETRLVTKLLATTAVTDLVSTRIVPITRFQGSDVPAITYQRVGTDTLNHSAGRCDVAWARLQLNLIDDDYIGAQRLADAVRTALGNWSSSTGTPNIDSCHWDSEIDAPEPIIPGQSVQLQAVMQDWLVQYKST